jgi:hypothetical protein
MRRKRGYNEDDRRTSKNRMIQPNVTATVIATVHDRLVTFKAP